MGFFSRTFAAHILLRRKFRIQRLACHGEVPGAKTDPHEIQSDVYILTECATQKHGAGASGGHQGQQARQGSESGLEPEVALRVDGNSQVLRVGRCTLEDTPIPLLPQHEVSSTSASKPRLKGLMRSPGRGVNCPA